MGAIADRREHQVMATETTIVAVTAEPLADGQALGGVFADRSHDAAPRRRDEGPAAA